MKSKAVMAVTVYIKAQYGISSAAASPKIVFTQYVVGLETQLIHITCHDLCNQDP
jgi:hypothetical protein